MSRASEAELIDSENLGPGFQRLAGIPSFAAPSSPGASRSGIGSSGGAIQELSKRRPNICESESAH
jgi:hypothetical protein